MSSAAGAEGRVRHANAVLVKALRCCCTAAERAQLPSSAIIACLCIAADRARTERQIRFIRLHLVELALEKLLTSWRSSSQCNL
jgi:hypothetical protein